MGRQTFKIVSGGGLAWLECLALGELPWLVHAFSTRHGGVSRAPCAGLNLSFTESDRRARVEENRRRFLAQTGTADFEWATVRQVHSTHAFVVTRASTGELQYQLPGAESARPEAVRPLQGDTKATARPAPAHPPAGDAAMTAEPGILLSVRIADCLPVLLADPQRRAVAVVHAGWRGALARIIEKAVGDMRGAFGSDPAQFVAALGPSIRACCYDVGEAVVDAFQGAFPRSEKFFQKLPDRPEGRVDRPTNLFLSDYPPGHAPVRVPAARLDLIAVGKDQLATAGVKLSHIFVADYCTACRTDLFFSHRKEGAGTGRQMAAIGIR